MGKWNALALTGVLVASPASAQVCRGDIWLDVCIDFLVSCVAEATHMPGDGTNGTPLAYEDCGDGTIADLNTGLMWENKVQYKDPAIPEPCLTDLHHLWGRCDWWEATGPWIDAVNDEAYAGYTDWRLPHIKELMSIADYTRALPTLPLVFGGGRNVWYRTITDYAIYDLEPRSGDLAWVVGTNGSSAVAYDWDGFGVRAVRNGRCPEGD